jgi:hypothetical protein
MGGGGAYKNKIDSMINTTFQNKLFDNYKLPEIEKDITSKEISKTIVEIAELGHFNKGMIFGVTKGWSIHQLKSCLHQMKANDRPEIAFWKYRKLSTR